MVADILGHFRIYKIYWVVNKVVCVWVLGKAVMFLF